ncbi:MAG: Major Facilitator Superfamily protein [Candidatus Accumulibacter vicinus]|uniref:Major Facilitator Superfamily protein n=2 Tax=Candidatus Accumulibacter vicinus TaxID=2954382 RepID=A0A084Y5M9_9PROT|nr:MAG: Major Facilitator Superfamily protein [Candidatus Accumulibacter vicinus]
MTFVIAWMKGRQFTPPEIGLFWGSLGLAVMASPYLWRASLASSLGGRTLGASCVVLTGATALLSVDASLPMMLLSACLFGSSMFTGPAAITVMVRNGSPRETWGAGIAGFTIAFGLGQAVGPVVSGWIGDLTGSLTLALLVSSAILATAAAIAFLQKDVRAPA